MIRAYLTALIYKILWFFIIPSFKRKYRPTILNTEVIPKKGSVVFCGNHRHKMDQYFIVAATHRVIHWVAKEEYFNGKDSIFGNPTRLSCWVTTIFLKMMGTISVDRNTFSSFSLKAMLRYLHYGSCIGIFPEGTRNKSKDQLLPFKKGAVMLAQKSDSWIQPVAITGNYTKDNSNLIISFGKPFKVGQMELDEANTELCRKILSGIEENKKNRK